MDEVTHLARELWPVLAIIVSGGGCWLWGWHERGNHHERAEEQPEHAHVAIVAEPRFIGFDPFA